MAVSLSPAPQGVARSCRGSAANLRRQLAISCIERAALGGSKTGPVRCRSAFIVSAEQQVVAVTGATGFVGKKLVSELLRSGMKVKVLTRDALGARFALGPEVLFNKDVSFHVHDTLSGRLEWFDAVKGCTGVVNLAGSPISTRWDADVKRGLLSSRITATKLVVDSINALPEAERPSVLVSGSAVGFYGTDENQTFDERTGPGRDFLADLCVRWEAAAKKVQGVRTVLLRTGIVLGPGGGALGKLLPLFYAFSGGVVGSGRQWVSWIHRDDLVRLIMQSLADERFAGPVNATAPAPVRFAPFTDALALATGRPAWLPVPGIAIRILLGEGATLVLDGQKVLPRRAQELNFQFQFTDVNDALAEIVGGRPLATNRLLPLPKTEVPAAEETK